MLFGTLMSLISVPVRLFIFTILVSGTLVWFRYSYSFWHCLGAWYYYCLLKILLLNCLFQGIWSLLLLLESGTLINYGIFWESGTLISDKRTGLLGFKSLACETGCLRWHTVWCMNLKRIGKKTCKKKDNFEHVAKECCVHWNRDGGSKKISF